jgi:hypothetical protein
MFSTLLLFPSSCSGSPWPLTATLPFQPQHIKVTSTLCVIELQHKGTGRSDNKVVDDYSVSLAFTASLWEEPASKHSILISNMDSIEKGVQGLQLIAG